MPHPLNAPATPPTAAPATTPARVAMIGPAARSGPTPGMARAPIPARRPIAPPTTAPEPPPAAAPSGAFVDFSVAMGREPRLSGSSAEISDDGKPPFTRTSVALLAASRLGEIPKTAVFLFLSIQLILSLRRALQIWFWYSITRM